MLKNFFDQIVQHKMMAVGEGLDKTGDVSPALQRECGQLQVGGAQGFPDFDASGGMICAMPCSLKYLGKSTEMGSNSLQRSLQKYIIPSSAIAR